MTHFGRFCLFALSVTVGLAIADTHASHVARCTSKCQRQNACQESLDEFSCDNSCKATCQCVARSAHMLNKPTHCTASMLEAHKQNLRRLSLFKKATVIKKAVLQEKQPEFSEFVPVADAFPASPPAMLNLPKPSLSLLPQHHHIARHRFLHDLLQANTTKIERKNATAATAQNKTQLPRDADKTMGTAKPTGVVETKPAAKDHA